MDAHKAFEILGMPEGRIPLAHATVYLATSPKSNSAYAALGAAMEDVEHGKTLSVPAHLRTPTRKKLASRTYYTPSENGLEKRIKERLDYWASQHQKDN